MLNLMSFSPSNFGRYTSQTEQSINETNGIDEWSQSPSPPPPPPPPQQSSTVTDNPSFIPISTTSSPPIIPTTNTQKIAIPSSIIKDDVEPLPFPQHGPGPIQRPNKLTCPPTQQQSTSSYLAHSLQSPGTPDVLDQINRLLDHQNSTTPTVSSTANVNNSSLPINDLTTPNIPWTPFAPPEWSTKYDSSWPLTNIQSPTIPLNPPVRNPFALMSTMNGQPQRPTTGEEATVWSSALGTATPRLISSSIRTQRASQWNEIFQSTVPSSNESTKPTNNSWFWTAPDPSSADVTTPNGHQTEPNTTFWSLGTLSNEPVVPSTISNPQATATTAWWSNTSDENNNTNQTNHLNDDPTNNRDQSRWEFAR